MNVQTRSIFSTYPPFKLNAFDTTGPWLGATSNVALCDAGATASQTSPFSCAELNAYIILINFALKFGLDMRKCACSCIYVNMMAKIMNCNRVSKYTGKHCRMPVCNLCDYAHELC